MLFYFAVKDGVCFKNLLSPRLRLAFFFRTGLLNFSSLESCKEVFGKFVCLFGVLALPAQ